ncbi:hypothetical protein J1614_001608 [Plenodomus biglobosus]|nr:hypothetical protein J1614_001608 [Plenodomus biglobosus]
MIKRKPLLISANGVTGGGGAEGEREWESKSEVGEGATHGGTRIANYELLPSTHEEWGLINCTDSSEEDWSAVQVALWTYYDVPWDPVAADLHHSKQTADKKKCVSAN